MRLEFCSITENYEIPGGGKNREDSTVRNGKKPPRHHGTKREETTKTPRHEKNSTKVFLSKRPVPPGSRASPEADSTRRFETTESTPVTALCDNPKD